MNDQDWESRINELRDAQLVTQRLMERLERKVDEHEDGIAEMRSAITTLASHSGELHEAVGELQTAMISLVAQIDRFVQGRDSNGHWTVEIANSALSPLLNLSVASALGRPASSSVVN